MKKSMEFDMNFNTTMAYPKDVPKEIKKEVELLYPSPYLFGSRYMSQFWPYRDRAKDSDWDFAFPYRGSEYWERDKATKLGWKPKETLKYMDNASFAVYEKEVAGYKVQMCSKINMTVFKTSWERLDPDFYWKYLHKSSSEVLPKKAQTDFFNQMYKAVGW